MTRHWHILLLFPTLLFFFSIPVYQVSSKDNSPPYYLHLFNNTILKQRFHMLVPHVQTAHIVSPKIRLTKLVILASAFWGFYSWSQTDAITQLYFGLHVQKINHPHYLMLKFLLERQNDNIHVLWISTLDNSWRHCIHNTNWLFPFRHTTKWLYLIRLDTNWV